MSMQPLVTQPSTWIALGPVVILAVTSFLLFLADAINLGLTSHSLVPSEDYDPQ
ncbi:MAG: hypothetical protein IH933_01355 [Euryarchaeota archaeon]|nr:hypothetical protein [Euryarchaeota archaeon]